MLSQQKILIISRSKSNQQKVFNSKPYQSI